MTEEQRRILIKAQQGELDGVETYLMLADTVHNEADKKLSRLLRQMRDDMHPCLSSTRERS
jgi:hypothetical protein